MEQYTVEDLELQKAKNLLSRYGKQIILMVTFAICAYAVSYYYDKYNNSQYELASVEFESMLNGARKQDLKLTESHANTLKNKFAKTPYAELSALTLAKFAVEGGELNKAEENLRWIGEHSNKGPIYHIAQVRLAKVLIAQNKNEEALKILNSNGLQDFSALYEDAKGDFLLAKGETSEAREAYKKAIAAAPKQIPMPWIQMKLNDLGVKE